VINYTDNILWPFLVQYEDELDVGLGPELHLGILPSSDISNAWLHKLYTSSIFTNLPNGMYAF
jgi:hypothetical protein